MAAKKNLAITNRCPLVTDSQLRTEANKQTDSIQSAFPPGVSRPALRAFAAAGYTRLEQLAKVNDDELLQLHGVGPKALRLIRKALPQSSKS